MANGPGNNKRVVKVYRSTPQKKKKRTLMNIPNGALYAALLVILVLVGYFGTKLVQDMLRDEDDYFPTASNSQEENPSGDTSEDLGEESSELEESSEIPGQDSLLKTGVIADISNYEQQIRQLADDNYQAVIVDLKDENGIVYYQSAAASQYDAVSADAVDAKMLVQAITEEGLYPIARIQTLKDPLAAHGSNNNSYMIGSSTWYDADPNSGGKRWLNPYMDNTKTYIADLTAELGQAGFSGIILDSLQFPERQYSIGYVDQYTTKSEVLKEVLEQASAAAGSDVAVYAQFDLALYESNAEDIYGGQLSAITSEAVLAIDGDVQSSVSTAMRDTGLDTVNPVVSDTESHETLAAALEGSSLIIYD